MVCGKRRKREVFLGLEVACVAEDDAHAEAHGEEHLACCRHPHLGTGEFGEVRVPHEGEALADTVEREHACHENEAHDKEDGHAYLVGALDTLAHAEREHAHVAGERDEEEYEGYGNGAHAEDGRQESDGPEMLGPALLLVENDVESARCGAVVVAARIAPEAPFHPREGNPEKHESDEVGDDKGAATVGGRLHREAQEVAEPDGGTCDCEDYAQLGTPVFTIALHCDTLRLVIKTNLIICHGVATAFLVIVLPVNYAGLLIAVVTGFFDIL